MKKYRVWAYDKISYFVELDAKNIEDDEEISDIEDINVN